jgi:teichuronic acid biosynthesis glycosyltransferase TuaC
VPFVKVLHITNAYPIESNPSFGVFVKEQVDGLRRLGIQSDLYFINAREEGLARYASCIPDLQRLGRHCDLVHCHHLFSSISYILSGVPAPFIAATFGDIRQAHPIERLCLYIVERFARRVIYKNDTQFDSPKYVYVPNGVDATVFRRSDRDDAITRLGLDPSTRYVLFVAGGGVDNPVKRYDKFLTVLDQMEAHGDRYTPLVMADVDREHVPDYYNASRFLLMTSDHEGSPNAVKEAMASNLPVVSTDVGNVRTMTADYDGGFVSSTGDSNDLARLAQEADSCVPNNGPAVLESLQLEAAASCRRLIQVYEQVLDENSERNRTTCAF